MKYIIDTDPGIDDAIALMMAYINKLDIIGFTLTSGNIEREKSENNLKIIQNVLKSNIKMFRGSINNKPNMYAPFAHGEDGLGGIDFPIQTNREFEKISAENFIINSIHKYKDDLTLICLGPLTNLASAIKKDPSIVNDLGTLIIMGTSFNPRSDEIYKEFNTTTDIESAKKVLTSKFKNIKIVTHEIGVSSYVPMDIINSLGNSIIGKFTYIISQKYIEFTLEHNHIVGLSTPDPTTIASIIDPSIITFKPCSIDDNFKVTLTDKSNIYVSTDVDRNKFRELFIKTFKN